jgi:signal transduction histidine kinase
VDLLGERCGVGGSQPDAESVGPARAEFLGNVSHEFGTPLAAIVAYAQDSRHTHGGTIAVRTNHDGTVTRVTATGTGEGIAPEDLPSVSERSKTSAVRVSAADVDQTHRGDTGIGLGLYICRHIVEAHGGTITIDSRPGVGTAVRFTLPLDVGGPIRTGAHEPEMDQCGRAEHWGRFHSLVVTQNWLPSGSASTVHELSGSS